jgi:hypothetical protein
MYIGETEAFNSTHERWCQSKEPISIKLYGISKLMKVKKIKQDYHDHALNMSTVAKLLANTCTDSYMHMLYISGDSTGTIYQGFSLNYTNNPNKMTFACV